MPVHLYRLWLLLAMLCLSYLPVQAQDLIFANNGLNRLCLNDGSGSFTCSDVSNDANSSLGIAVPTLPVELTTLIARAQG